MSSKLYSCAVVGLDSKIVEVEAEIYRYSYGRVVVVGLPDTAVQEARERVRAAIENSNTDFPKGKVTINLAPADLRKEGPLFDLPMALAVLMAKKELYFDPTEKLFVGELSLDGSLRHTNGILPIAIMAKEKGFKTLFVPEVNAREAALIEGLEVIPVKSLYQLVLHLLEKETIFPFKQEGISKFYKEEEFKEDMAYIKGQEHVKRAMEIAASGGHNMIMSGPPGSGKTLLARTMPSILPKMTVEESLETTKIYSIAGMLPSDIPLITKRPLRSPHHTASGVALVGGGTFPKPGEISLAHRGVLFLDEFPEFPRQVLESLRQPLEEGIITVSRAQGSVTFPAKFILIAAQNPCPCGYATDLIKECICSPSQIAKYKKRISGPLLDRIDLHVEVPKVEYEKLTEDKVSESSKEIRKRVQKARDIQQRRFQNLSITCNSEMGPREIRKFCVLDLKTKELLKSAVNQMHLSARAYHRILKLARTIADLDGEDLIKSSHIAEALQYRPRDG